MPPSPTRAASPRPRWRSLLAAAGLSACLVLVAAACGDDDSGQIPQTGNVSQTTTTSETTTTTEATSTVPQGQSTESSTTSTTASPQGGQSTTTTTAGG